MIVQVAWMKIAFSDAVLRIFIVLRDASGTGYMYRISMKAGNED